MAEELGTKDVLEQIDARLGNVEQDVRDLRSEMNGLRSDLTGEIAGLRSDMNVRFESQTRWLVGVVFASWLTMIASIWLKN